MGNKQAKKEKKKLDMRNKNLSIMVRESFAADSAEAANAQKSMARLKQLEDRFDGEVSLYKSGRDLHHQGTMFIQGTHTKYGFFLLTDLLVTAEIDEKGTNLVLLKMSPILDHFRVENLVPNKPGRKNCRLAIYENKDKTVLRCKDEADKTAWLDHFRQVGVKVEVKPDPYSEHKKGSKSDKHHDSKHHLKGIAKKVVLEEKVLHAAHHDKGHDDKNEKKEKKPHSARKRSNSKSAKKRKGSLSARKKSVDNSVESKNKGTSKKKKKSTSSPNESTSENGKKSRKSSISKKKGAASPKSHRKKSLG